MNDTGIMRVDRFKLLQLCATFGSEEEMYEGGHVVKGGLEVENVNISL